MTQIPATGKAVKAVHHVHVVLWLGRRDEQANCAGATMAAAVLLKERGSSTRPYGQADPCIRQERIPCSILAQGWASTHVVTMRASSAQPAFLSANDCSTHLAIIGVRADVSTFCLLAGVRERAAGSVAAYGRWLSTALGMPAAQSLQLARRSVSLSRCLASFRHQFTLTHQLAQS
jgi:hypothetical protein